MAWAWARPAEVEPCLAAATGGECAVRMSGGVARLCGAVARGATGAVVHGKQAVGVLLAHDSVMPVLYVLISGTDDNGSNAQA